jgi:thymidine phosphorylase
VKQSFLPQEVIRHKRDGHALSEQQIKDFVAGISDHTLSEGQVAAFAMAVYFQGLLHEEQVYFTKAMRDSGDTLAWDPDVYGGKVVDKHSTGGVGDKVSFMLAPIVAAAGGYVPMIAGRGLGHTGGTVDKLESIPGYDPLVDSAKFRATVDEVGCAIIGQTSEVATADKRLYGIRDVTATVESIPLITGSILSKKLAAGLDGLVMDVKFGTGAFMAEREQAKALAENIAKVAVDAGLPTTCVLTDMNEVLGYTAGNALEIVESLDFLMGNGAESRLEQVTIELAVHMLLNVGIAADVASAHSMVSKALSSGAAAERFFKMVSLLGGPADFENNYTSYLPSARIIKPVPAPVSGYVGSMNARDVGLAVVMLGGGRSKAGQAIDLSVGLSGVVSVGSEIMAGDPICFVHGSSESTAESAVSKILDSISITESKPKAAPVVQDIIYPTP